MGLGRGNARRSVPIGSGSMPTTIRCPRRGLLFLLLEPDEILARLATLVPPPRIHSVRYHGIFAPNSKAAPTVSPGPTC
jgi:hypothetical protein